MSYLTRFPVSKLKIDRSFVSCIGVNPTSETLIETILAMAEKLDIQVVAEGVETEEQLTYLRKRNCHYVQGYLLGRPCDVAEFTARVVQENRLILGR